MKNSDHLTLTIGKFLNHILPVNNYILILFYDEIFNHLGRTYIDMKSENNDMT